MRWIGRGAVLTLASVLATGYVVASEPAGAATKALTVHMTVEQATWNQVQHELSASSDGSLFTSTQDFIYGFLCENQGSWTAPIPRVIKRDANGIHLAVKLSASQVKKASKALKSSGCGIEGIKTISGDYRRSSTANAIDFNLKILSPSSSTTTTTTSPPSPAAYEASCTNQMPYTQLVKDPDNMKGQCITEQGQVFQYDTATGLTDMLVAIDNDGYGDWSDNVEVKLPDASAGNGIYEHDVVQFWGPISGSDTYTDTSGGSQTVPVVKAQYITLISSAGG